MSDKERGATNSVATDGDRVARLVADVTRLQPQIDPKSKSIGAGLLHLSDQLQQLYSLICAQFGLSLSGQSVLTTLRRHAPRQLTLVEINRDALVTSGGITFVVSQLESKGLVERRPHPNDRRSSLLSLTSRGRRVADRVIAAVAKTDARITEPLSAQDRDRIEHFLHVLQEGVESARATQLPDRNPGPNTNSK